MGAYTTFDETKQDLEEKLKECTTLFDKMLDEDTWGYDEWSKEYIDLLHKKRFELYNLRKNI